MLKCKIFIDRHLHDNFIMSNILNNQISSQSVQIAPTYSFTIALERDGVINQIVTPCVSSPDYFIPIERSLEAIALMRSKKYNIVVITDQPAAGRGFMTPQDIDLVHQRMLELLGQANCPSLNGIYYSISGVKDDIYVKPNIGMFQRAAQEVKVDFKGGVVVGDDIEDLKSAIKIGATPILVLTGNGQETLKKLNRYANRDLKRRTLVFDTLWDFAMSIPEQTD
jgi:D-glycero-D-manno-heptose 1,7-bisphosphate phosphatase